MPDVRPLPGGAKPVKRSYTQQVGVNHDKFAVYSPYKVELDTIALTTQAANQMYFVHTDHLGTPQVLTDSDQQVVWEAKQTPFGELVSEQGAATQPLRFPGQYADPETGFSYNYFRDYDSTIGRYVQSDPIGLAGGLNTYGYAFQNPLRYVDPYGLEVTGYYYRDTGEFAIYDKDTHEIATGTFESGGKPYGNPIEPGTYDILDHPNLDFFA